MNILYIQHVDKLPPSFPQFLDIVAKEGTGLGKVIDKGWIVTTDSMIHGEGAEAAAFNDFMALCRQNGFDSLYTTKNPH